jgi:subtilisin-like proprotein convertase family protein
VIGYRRSAVDQPWTLVVTDGYRVDTGTLDTWTITV